MATELNFYREENKDGELFEKPLLVTIALEEYRSLVKENTYQAERITWLESEIDRLYAEISKFSAPKGCVENA